MKISVKQTGGFAGISMVANVDSTTLPPLEAEKLQKIVQNSNFFQLPSRLPSQDRNAADYLNYKITVETEDKKNTVEASENSLSSDLRNLVDFSMDYERKKNENS